MKSVALHRWKKKTRLKPTEKMGGGDEDTGKVDHSLQHFDTEGGKRIRDLENSWRAALNWRLPLNLCNDGRRYFDACDEDFLIKEGRKF